MKDKKVTKTRVQLTITDDWSRSWTGSSWWRHHRELKRGRRKRKEGGELDASNLAVVEMQGRHGRSGDDRSAGEERFRLVERGERSSSSSRSRVDVTRTHATVGHPLLHLTLGNFLNNQHISTENWTATIMPHKKCVTLPYLLPAPGSRCILYLGRGYRGSFQTKRSWGGWLSG